MTTVWNGLAFNCPSTGNQISLHQKTNGVVAPTASRLCGKFSAVTTNVSTDGYCYTSVLTIPAVQGLNGTTVMCVDGLNGADVGSDTVVVKLAGKFEILLYYFQSSAMFMSWPVPVQHLLVAHCH